MGGLRARLDSLSRGELAGLVVVIVVTLAGAGLWYMRSLPRPVDIAASTGAPAPSSAAAGVLPSGTAPAGTTAPVPSGSAVPAAMVIVDVAGWVRNPGVYEFPAGARVIDAVEEAGGARDGAELSLLNLAAPLADGQQILVPKEGEAPVGAAPVGGTPGTGTSAGGMININTADATAFETLNGIGEVLAAAIVTYRDEHGPFTSVDQLEDVPGIGPSTLEEIRPQVTV
jgi:competence protein ComEA